MQVKEKKKMLMMVIGKLETISFFEEMNNFFFQLYMKNNERSRKRPKYIYSLLEYKVFSFLEKKMLKKILYHFLSLSKSK